MAQQLQILEGKPTSLSLITVAFSSIFIALLVLGMRWLGIFQSWELKSLDQMMNLLPPETPDERLLIVGADEKDLRLYGHPIPDNILAKLLAQLNQYQPYTIGLDIVRDQPVPPGYQDLSRVFKTSKNLVAGCAFGGNNPNQRIKHPPLIPLEQIGFIDVYSEDSQYNNQDYTVRRYLLSRSSNPENSSSICNTPYSFGWQLTYRYLKNKNIPVTVVGDNWKFGDLLILRLQPHSGGYQKIDARGNQILLRYRKTPDPQKIAPQLSFREVLNKTAKLKPNLVKNRVVLIGVVAASVPDPHDTPYGRIRGLYVHAHLVSQLLSAVEDKHRSLIWWFPWWGDALWIMLWSLTAGLWIRWHQKPLAQSIALGFSIVLLYGCCWFGLIQAAWFPFIPSLLALIVTGISLIGMQIFLRQRDNDNL